jgi:diacylglycerol kinase family enzyme
MAGGLHVDDRRIKVIATTISGSIKDWGKTKKIVPLFRTYGREDVSLYEVDSHAEARTRTRDLVKNGSRIIISAGGSGTFNSVLEGCLDAKVGLANITLGFLRKGSADLIGKTLGMPDDVESAIKVFVASLVNHRTVKCDVIQAVSGAEGAVPRHFVGYGGAEIFGRIPHYTENRFIKYYKGLLGQLFGDLGPFFVGASLSVLEKSFRRILGKRMVWKIYVDGREASSGYYQAMIIVNGYLGPDLPFAQSVPLGSGDFYIFTIRDLGMARILSQFRHAWDSSIMAQSGHWGFESFCIKKELKIENESDKLFPVNVDGSTLNCLRQATFKIVDHINLLSKN